MANIFLSKSADIVDAPSHGRLIFDHEMTHYVFQIILVCIDSYNRQILVTKGIF